MVDARQGDVAYYERFLRHTLHRDLRFSEKSRTSTKEEILEYEKLRKSLQLFEKLGAGTCRALVDLGPQVYAQGEVEDTSMLLVDVGIGFHVECTSEEAVQVCQLREEFLREREQVLLSSTASIKANIRLVSEGLDKLQNL
mmetsp:Transcript_1748/g.10770  ORF Transcript_1748/g.10770 Transcript_1748/m.10770 type:complete len:141 (-) Transcript_1748:1898-2320(-)